MITPKLIYYTHKTYSDGTHPVIIQVSVKGKIKRKVVARATVEQWSEKLKAVTKKHPHHEQVNNAIKKAFSEVMDKLNNGKDPFSNEGGDNIYSFIEGEIRKHDIKKQISVVAMYRIMVRDLIGFDDTFPRRNFQEITPKYIEGMYYYLLSDDVGNSLNMAAKKISRLRTLFKRAKLSGIEVPDPFGTFDTPKTKTIKRKLTDKEFVSIRTVDLGKYGARANTARDIFVCCVYLRGIRIGDILRLSKSNINGDRLTYTESKTGNERRVKIRPEAMVIMDKYMDAGRERIFPLMPDSVTDKSDQHMLSKTIVSKINMGLAVVAKAAGIDKKLTTHIARHTFAKMAIDKVKNPRISQGLVGHSSLAVHQKYIEDLQDNDELDNAADDIFG